MTRPATSKSEDGSALVLALVFLSLFGLAIAAILSFADASIRTTFAVRSQGRALYGADGGVEGAINAIRTSGQGAYGGTCEPFMVPVNGEFITVTCEPQAGSGSASGTNNSSNKPPKAILTLGTNSVEGIDQASDAPLKVQGDVFSHGLIRNQASKATMAVTGDVSAYGNCTGTITSSLPPIHCANTGGGQSTANSVDPNYAHAGGSLSFPAIPACPAGGAWLVDLQPGRYTSAAALNALTAGGCGRKVLWFHPGTYYFDFEDASAAHEWVIDDANANVVGGTPKAWDPAAATRPAIPHPGACRSAADGAPNDGVQFIFGNDSRINVVAGAVELCARPSTTAQQIAVYGVKTTTGTPPGAPTSSPTCPSAGRVITLLPTGITATQGTWTAVDDGRIIDGSTANSSLPAQRPGGARSKVSLIGFDQSVIPVGCDVATQLIVSHREGNTDMQSITAIVTGMGATSTKTDSNWQQCTASTQLCLQSSPAENTVALGEFNQASHFATISMTWEARASNNKASTESLDGVRLEVTLSEPPASTPSPAPSPTPPASSDYYRAQSGCIVVVPYGAAGSCALLKAGAQTKLAVNGTLYAPPAAVDIGTANAASPVLGRGIIARHLKMSVVPDRSFSGDLVTVPDAGAGAVADRRVTLKAFIGAALRLRAVVVFGDGGGSSPGETVTVESWNVFR